MKFKILFLVTFLWAFQSTLFAQDITLLKDINPSGDADPYSYIGHVVYDGMLLFAADDGTHGVELWKTDGTEAGTVMVKDIFEGAEGSECENFFVVNNYVLFTANDGINGVELWRTDGTAEGTEMLQDIFLGIDDGIYYGSYPGNDFFVHNDILYFAGKDDYTNIELYRSDGTPEGTYLLKNISDDGTFSSGSYPEDYAALGNEFLFTAENDELWKSDGTEEGTVYVATLASLHNKVSMGDYILCFIGSSVYRIEDSFSTLEQLALVSSPGTMNEPYKRFTRIGDRAFFPAGSAGFGGELWVTDGTPGGTYMVKDAQPGTGGYPPQSRVVLGDKLVYKYDDEEHGHEPWISDGTSDGTHMIKDIASGGSSSLNLPTQIFSDGEHVYMRSGTPFNQEPWISNGTEAGTFELENLKSSGSSNPRGFVRYNDKIYFFATGDNYGRELYVFDPASLAELDMDSDGFSYLEDCDDTNANVYPGAEEVVNNDIDENCDGEIFIIDNDNDGYHSDEDCDDTNAAIYPGAEEIANNEIDENCDGEILIIDNDNDGYHSDEDCDDTNAAIYPGAEEIANNNIDEDCDGSDLVSATHNLDDTKITIYPIPFSGYLNIDLSDNHKSFDLEIFNPSGQLVHKQVLRSSARINFEDKPAGVYFLHLRDQESGGSIIENVFHVK